MVVPDHPPGAGLSEGHMEIRRLSFGFAVSPQLQRCDPAEAAARGFHAIVCNRPDGEAADQPGSAEIAAESERAGLVFAYMPVTPGQLTDSKALQLASFLKDHTGPVLGYCRTGARSEMLWQRASELANLDG
jgi:sulfide:quinone oxidoreductase